MKFSGYLWNALIHFFCSSRCIEICTILHLASENYKITHFRHIDKGHNSMCIELIFIKIAGQMQMIIINIFASFSAYKIFHIYFILIKNHEIGLWPWNFYMTPWGDFGGICFENAPDPKLALSKGLILLSEMSQLTCFFG